MLSEADSADALGPKRKATRSYLWLRWGTLGSILACAILGAFASRYGSYEAMPGKLVAAVIATLVPMVVLMLVAAQSLGPFPWKYSAFGPLERTQPPKERPRFELRAVATFFGEVTSAKCGFAIATWRFHDSGVELDLLLLGKCFLVYEQFTHEAKSLFPRGTRFYHRSPEVRSPVAAPVNVAQALRAEIARCRADSTPIKAVS